MKPSKTKKSAKKPTKKPVHSKNNKLVLIYFLIGIFILGIILTSFIFINTKIQKTNKLIDYIEINVSVPVVECGVGGFNTDTEYLKYGKVCPGGSSQRSFDLTSKEKVLVEIRVEGEMASFLTFTPNDFILENDELTRVFSNLVVPIDAELRNYSDTIKIYFYKQ